MGIMEKTTRGTGPTEYRHMIPAGSGTAILTRRSDLTNSTYYVTTDHLGSGDLVMDSAATVLARESFTPFGARRGSNWQGIPTTGDYSAFASTTRRGFTGHEMLDSVSLIHMNGRVYDPYLGRFLSADPIIQTLAISQAINPFSYVMNNPLSLIDPSGYSWLSKLFSGIGHFLHKYWRVILAVIVVWFAMPFIAGLISSNIAASAAASSLAATGSATIAAEAGATMAACAAPWIGVVAGAAAGAISGAIVGGFKGALVGAISGGLFGASSAAWSHVGGAAARGWGEAVTSAIGGASSEALGGQFRDGFWFAFTASGASSIYRNAVKYRETWQSGGDAVQKTDISPPVEGANNFGLQGADVNNPGFWAEGGTLSRFANHIPGMNAIAGMHDVFVTHISGVWRNILNVPLMPPAAALSIAALASSAPVQIAYDQTRANGP